MNTSTSPSDAHEPSIATSRGLPSASARSASLTTVGSEHAPPIQPVTPPSGVIRAWFPSRAEVGRSTRTTVANA